MRTGAIAAGKTKPGKVEIGSFAWYVKKLREESGLSQSKLAEFGEFDHSYVSRLEAGTRMPTREAVIRLAKAMELPEGDDRREKLLDLAGFRTLRGSVHFSSNVILELNSEYRLATPETQQEVAGTLALLIEIMRCRNKKGT